MFDFISRLIFKYKYKGKIISNEKVTEIFNFNNTILDFNNYLATAGFKYDNINFIENFNKTANEFFATLNHNCLDFANIYKNFCDYKNLQSELVSLKKPYTLTYHKILIIIFENKIYLQSNNILTVFNSRQEIIEYYKNKGFIEI